MYITPYTHILYTPNTPKHPIYTLNNLITPQEELRVVEAKVAALTATLNEMKEKKASLERDIEDTKNKVSLTPINSL